ncbi:MAG: MBL fold metallo-hydrolase [Candidatus Micrarchaeia archaeon]
MELLFLGTGGARFVVLKQLRATAGFIIKGEANLYIDPGPGALLKSVELKQELHKLDGVLVSHAHIDHSNDANLIIEGMTNGGKRKRGVLIGSSSAVEGNERFDRVISKYHQKMVEKALVAKPGDVFSVKGVKIRVTPTKHDDENGVGFIFTSKQGVVGYTGDTEYFPELGEIFRNCNLLVLNNLKPAGCSYPGHLNTEMTIRILKEAKPKKAVIQHFGMAMLRAGPEAEARLIQKETGVETVAAKDGMSIRIGGSLTDFQE